MAVLMEFFGMGGIPEENGDPVKEGFRWNGYG